ncbi:hypothetical protein ElyMa_001376300 [Elysia marginata]|uniref:Uncharacterized protein n=1 Tax=Elysia marginata TaxID=1093978 RepID=A0AAV4IS50_9GAST|nr:hypothetical protein ElyMa_001376300 [Elysia marginata]
MKVGPMCDRFSHSPITTANAKDSLPAIPNLWVQLLQSFKSFLYTGKARAGGPQAPCNRCNEEFKHIRVKDYFVLYIILEMFNDGLIGLTS